MTTIDPLREEEVQKAEDDFEAASKKLKANSKNVKNEGVYAAEYQRLVRLGQRMQLREKRRG